MEHMAYILIIDDDPDIANASANVLRSEGHEIETQLVPEDAMKSIEKRRPDLIILDVMFPGDASGGFELARWLSRKFKESKQSPVPVVMVSAINQKVPFGFSNSDIDDAWLPVSEFMEKPIDFEILKSKVKFLLTNLPKGR
jgi:DNA-binding response OmpR family regulator